MSMDMNIDTPSLPYIPLCTGHKNTGHEQRVTAHG